MRGFPLANKKDGFVLIHGKEYATVAFRIFSFRKLYPDGQILTSLEVDDGEKVIMKSVIILDDLQIATGWAEEIRGSSQINTPSALENCETSSIGRALAIAGFDTSGQIASADEVESAVEQQAVMDEKISKEQEKAIGDFLGNQEDGADLLEKLLNRAKVDHLKELSKKHAEKCISTWSIEL